MLTAKLKLYDISVCLCAYIFFFPTIADNWNFQNCNIGIEYNKHRTHVIFAKDSWNSCEREKNTTKV